MDSRSATPPLLLLSGAGLPAWIWDDVRAELDAETVVAEYPRRAGAVLGEYAEAALAQAPAGPVTLVAHSIGGVVASVIVALAPERVAGVLGVAAVVPAAGRSFLGALPVPQRYVVGLAMRVAGTRPPEKMIRAGVAAGLPEPVVARLVADFAPESQRLYRDRVAAREFTGPRGFVATSRDREFPLALQHRYADTLGAGFRRELATGHLPMLEAPAASAQAIAEFAADTRGRETPPGVAL
ncbi:alpha/beta hydrolase [Nocardia sp. NPDC050435]|uniref:alpha/beta fold hydrolase n=1 Tax=Nocardia sp. NPDC050435 TaxID=3155040 RepID=UPI0033D84438